MRPFFFSLAIVVFLSCISFVVAQNIRGNPIEIQDAKNKVDERDDAVVNQIGEAISRLLGRKRDRGNRNKRRRKWEDLE